MMSANVHEISPLRGDGALHDGALHDAILMKPFDLRDVLERIGKLLRLVWETEAVPPATAGTDRITAPAPEHVDELLRLGRMGHVRGIEAKLAQMDGEAGVPPAFVARMRGLVQGYDLRGYLAELQGLARDG